VKFDEAVGLGEVEAGPIRYPFHCTQIADGSRVVAVGTVVSFGLLAGRGGRWEAADLRAGPSGPAG
jgi:CspA family cold shock protein